MEWSRFQKAVFQDVAKGSGHTVVQSVAGSGKTTTAVESLRYVPRWCSTLFAAFQRSTRDNLKAKVPRNIAVQTAHGFGWMCHKRAHPKSQVVKNKVPTLLRDAGLSDRFHRPIIKATSLAKAGLKSNRDGIKRIIEAHGLVDPPKRTDKPSDVQKRADQVEWMIDWTLTALRQSLKQVDSVDFDDMIWLPLMMDTKIEPFDRVFIDETQDLNASQLSLFMRACPKTHAGRITAIGDPRQAIYAFRGADHNAVDLIVTKLAAKVLPLSVCYRCARSIVESVQHIAPEIEAAPGAEEGIVAKVDADTAFNKITAGDFVLSRTNAPLIDVYLKLHNMGRVVSIRGRDIGQRVIDMVRKADADTVGKLRQQVSEWGKDEYRRLMNVDPPMEHEANMARDTSEIVLAVARHADTIANVIERLDYIFTDDPPAGSIILSSTHKAKGLEAPRVVLLRDTYLQKDTAEERNLFYVASTRARSELYLVEGIR